MASELPDLRSPSQPQSIKALWPVASYTAWWQRHTGVSSLPKATAQWCLGRTSSGEQQILMGCHTQQINETQLAYRKAVAADARFLHALRSSVLLEIETELAFTAVFTCARLTLATSNSSPSWSLTRPYLSFVGLWRSTARRPWLPSLLQLHTAITNYWGNNIHTTTFPRPSKHRPTTTHRVDGLNALFS